MNLNDLFNECCELQKKLEILQSKIEKSYNEEVHFNSKFTRKREFKRFKRSLDRMSMNFGYLLYILNSDLLDKSARNRSE